MDSRTESLFPTQHAEMCPGKVQTFSIPPPNSSTESHGLTPLQNDFLYRNFFVKFLFQATTSLAYDFVGGTFFDCHRFYSRSGNQFCRDSFFMVFKTPQFVIL